MKVDVKNNNNFEANIKRSLAGNQYILTIKSGDKTIDIIFENYDELKTVHNIIGRELMTAYTFESVTIDAINENNNNGRSGGSGGCTYSSSDTYLSSEERVNGYAVGISPSVTEFNADAIDAYRITDSGIHKVSTSSYTNTSGKEYSDTKPI